MSLPEPRDPAQPYRVCLVCLGNICRSPMAEQVVRTELERAGLDGAVRVDSAGTGSWHIGSPMDDRAASTLRIHGYLTDHVARRFDPEWFADRDLVLAMDADNQADLVRVAPAGDRDRIRLFLSFAADGGPHAEVPDPYYGGDDGFTTVLNMIEGASKGLVSEIAQTLRRR
ncbi:low molecular weight phosphotyrosine protein phosphatase [Spiractinospora alimapuensis]|uniref:low molecular weight protein-tyrosine-phosphatase n=1 Tax=Spiractinospora alimapuensis TaxID=2820884 RepID=UPI001F44692C|nr:low molecular weight protein-tyrosine-phosphatase [Spiractinospora alimapuensis]QVQ54120.1 low molecular weight phosphotyrosine protein phosphatase [Spiractinospora alimapuensis]